jgi:hypothetical protein
VEDQRDGAQAGEGGADLLEGQFVFELDDALKEVGEQAERDVGADAVVEAVKDGPDIDAVLEAAEGLLDAAAPCRRGRQRRRTSPGR